MPILVLRLTQPDERIHLDYSLPGFTKLFLVNWSGTGMSNGNPTLWMKFESQDPQTIYGNSDFRIPLMFEDSGTNPCMSRPYRVAGRIPWNSSRIIHINVSNFDHSPATFTELVLVFDGMEAQPQPMEYDEMDIILRQG